MSETDKTSTPSTPQGRRRFITRSHAVDLPGYDGSSRSDDLLSPPPLLPTPAGSLDKPTPPTSPQHVLSHHSPSPHGFSSPTPLIAPPAGSKQRQRTQLEHRPFSVRNLHVVARPPGLARAYTIDTPGTFTSSLDMPKYGSAGAARSPDGARRNTGKLTRSYTTEGGITFYPSYHGSRLSELDPRSSASSRQLQRESSSSEVSLRGSAASLQSEGSFYESAVQSQHEPATEEQSVKDAQGKKSHKSRPQSYCDPKQLHNTDFSMPNTAFPFTASSYENLQKEAKGDLPRSHTFGEVNYGKSKDNSSAKSTMFHAHSFQGKGSKGVGSHVVRAKPFPGASGHSPSPSRRSNDSHSPMSPREQRGSRHSSVSSVTADNDVSLPASISHSRAITKENPHLTAPGLSRKHLVEGRFSRDPSIESTISTVSEPPPSRKSVSPAVGFVEHGPRRARPFGARAQTLELSQLRRNFEEFQEPARRNSQDRLSGKTAGKDYNSGSRINELKNRMFSLDSNTNDKSVFAQVRPNLGSSQGQPNRNISHYTVGDYKSATMPAKMTETEPERRPSLPNRPDRTPLYKEQRQKELFSSSSKIQLSRSSSCDTANRDKAKGAPKKVTREPPSEAKPTVVPVSPTPAKKQSSVMPSKNKQKEPKQKSISVIDNKSNLANGYVKEVGVAPATNTSPKMGAVSDSQKAASSNIEASKQNCVSIKEVDKGLAQSEAAADPASDKPLSKAPSHVITNDSIKSAMEVLDSAIAMLNDVATEEVATKETSAKATNGSIVATTVTTATTSGASSAKSKSSLATTVTTSMVTMATNSSTMATSVATVVTSTAQNGRVVQTSSVDTVVSSKVAKGKLPASESKSRTTTTTQAKKNAKTPASLKSATICGLSETEMSFIVDPKKSNPKTPAAKAKKTENPSQNVISSSTESNSDSGHIPPSMTDSQVTLKAEDTMEDNDDDADTRSDIIIDAVERRKMLQRADSFNRPGSPQSRHHISMALPRDSVILRNKFKRKGSSSSSDSQSSPATPRLSPRVMRRHKHKQSSDSSISLDPHSKHLSVRKHPQQANVIPGKDRAGGDRGLGPPPPNRGSSLSPGPGHSTASSPLPYSSTLSPVAPPHRELSPASQAVRLPSDRRQESDISSESSGRHEAASKIRQVPAASIGAKPRAGIAGALAASAQVATATASTAAGKTGAIHAHSTQPADTPGGQLPHKTLKIPNLKDLVSKHRPDEPAPPQTPPPEEPTIQVKSVTPLLAQRPNAPPGSITIEPGLHPSSSSTSSEFSSPHSPGPHDQAGCVGGTQPTMASTEFGRAYSSSLSPTRTAAPSSAVPGAGLRVSSHGPGPSVKPLPSRGLSGYALFGDLAPKRGSATLSPGSSTTMITAAATESTATTSSTTPTSAMAATPSAVSSTLTNTTHTSSHATKATSATTGTPAAHISMTTASAPVALGPPPGSSSITAPQKTVSKSLTLPSFSGYNIMQGRVSPVASGTRSTNVTKVTPSVPMMGSQMINKNQQQPQQVHGASSRPESAKPQLTTATSLTSVSKQQTSSASAPAAKLAPSSHLVSGRSSQTLKTYTPTAVTSVPTTATVTMSSATTALGGTRDSIQRPIASPKFIRATQLKPLSQVSLSKSGHVRASETEERSSVLSPDRKPLAQVGRRVSDDVTMHGVHSRHGATGEKTIVTPSGTRLLRAQISAPEVSGDKHSSFVMAKSTEPSIPETYSAQRSSSTESRREGATPWRQPRIQQHSQGTHEERLEQTTESQQKEADPRTNETKQQENQTKAERQEQKQEQKTKPLTLKEVEVERQQRLKQVELDKQEKLRQHEQERKRKEVERQQKLKELQDKERQRRSKLQQQGSPDKHKLPQQGTEPAKQPQQPDKEPEPPQQQKHQAEAQTSKGNVTSEQPKESTEVQKKDIMEHELKISEPAQEKQKVETPMDPKEKQRMDRQERLKQVELERREKQKQQQIDRQNKLKQGEEERKQKLEALKEKERQRRQQEEAKSQQKVEGAKETGRGPSGEDTGVDPVKHQVQEVAPQEHNTLDKSELDRQERLKQLEVKKQEKQRKEEARKQEAERLQRVVQQEEDERLKHMKEQKDQRAQEDQKKLQEKQGLERQKKLETEKEVERQRRLRDEEETERRRKQEEEEELMRQQKAREQEELERHRKVTEQLEVEHHKVVREQQELERQRQVHERQQEMERQKKLKEKQQEIERQMKVRVQLEAERQRKAKELEMERQRKLMEQEEQERQKRIREQELEREKKLREQQLERERRLRKEELERERKLKEEAEIERQRKIREREELERQERLREEEEMERQRKLREQEELERQRKIMEQQEQERQRVLREQELEGQRELAQQRELERQRKIKEQLELEHQRVLREKEMDRQRQLQEQQELERQRKMKEQQEMEIQKRLQEELDRQRKIKEQQEMERKRQEEEMERQRKVKEQHKIERQRHQEDTERQMKIQEQQEIEKQRQQRQQQETERQRKIQEQQEIEKQRQQQEIERQRQEEELERQRMIKQQQERQQDEAERQRAAKEQQAELERKRLAEEQQRERDRVAKEFQELEKQRFAKEQQELESQRKTEQEEIERRRRVEEQQELDRQKHQQQRELEEQQRLRELQEAEHQRKLNEQQQRLEQLKQAQRQEEQQADEAHKLKERQELDELRHLKEHEMEQLRELRQQQGLERIRKQKEEQELEELRKLKEQELEQIRKLKEQELQHQKMLKQQEEADRLRRLKEEQEIQQQRKMEQQQEMERRKRQQQQDEMDRQRKLQQQEELDQQRKLREQQAEQQKKLQEQQLQVTIATDEQKIRSTQGQTEIRIQEADREDKSSVSPEKLGEDGEQEEKAMSVAQRIFMMQNKLEEEKFALARPSSGFHTPKMEVTNRSIAVSPAVGATTPQPASQKVERSPLETEEKALLDKLTQVADIAMVRDAAAEKRKRYISRNRDDDRRKTQPVTSAEIRLADAAADAEAKGETIEQHNKDEEEEEEVMVPQIPVKEQILALQRKPQADPKTMPKQRSLDDVVEVQPTISVRKQIKSFQLQKTSEPKSMSSLDVVNEEEKPKVPVSKQVKVMAQKSVEFDSQISQVSNLSDDEFDKMVETNYQKLDERKVALERMKKQISLEIPEDEPVAEDDLSKMTLSEKMSYFRQLDKNAAAIKKEKESSSRRLSDHKKKVHRSHTMPITDEDFQNSTSSSSPSQDEKSAPTPVPVPVVLASGRAGGMQVRSQRSEFNQVERDSVHHSDPEDKDEESSDELSKMSIADKVRLFSKQKEQKSPDKRDAVLRRKSRRTQSRFKTQSSDEPVTPEELEKARISPLAMSLVKPPDPEILQNLSLKDQRDYMAQWAESTLATKVGARPSSTVLSDTGPADGDRSDASDQSQKIKGILKPPDSQQANQPTPQQATEKQQVEVRGILKQSSMATTSVSMSTTEKDAASPAAPPRGILKSDSGLSEDERQEIHGILKQFREESPGEKQVRGILKKDSSLETKKEPEKGTLKSNSEGELPSQLERGVLKKTTSLELNQSPAEDEEDLLLREEPECTVLQVEAFLTESHEQSTERQSKDKGVVMRDALHSSSSAKSVDSSTDDDQASSTSSERNTWMRNEGIAKHRMQRELQHLKASNTVEEEQEELNKSSVLDMISQREQLDSDACNGSAPSSPQVSKAPSPDRPVLRRLTPDKETLDTPKVVLRDKKNGDPKERPHSIAERLTMLKDSQGTWKDKVEEKDMTKFTVEGKLVMAGLTPKPDSPLMQKRKLRTAKYPLKRDRESLSPSTSPEMSPTSPFARTSSLRLPASPKIPSATSLGRHGSFKETGCSSTSIPAQSTPNLSVKNASSSEATSSETEAEVPGPVRVAVPRADDEEYHSFFQTESTSSARVPVSVDDFDEIFLDANDILVTAKKIKPQRRKAATGNPLRRLAQRDDIQLEYTEVKSGIAEQEMKRIKREQIIGQTHFAQEALAGLASKENFSKVKLKKTDSGGTSTPGTGYRPYMETMLLQVKGRRHCQTRLVEPSPNSINSGDCFILVKLDRVFVWVGEYCNVIEKAKALELASHIQQKKDLGCKSYVDPIIVSEQLQENQAGQEFWNVLGGLDTYHEPGPPEEDELYEMYMMETNMVYRLEGEELVPDKENWGTPPRYALLDPNGALVFDFGSEMYVWTGKHLSFDSRKTVLRLAKQVWDQGYDFSDCDINPLTPLRTEDTGGLPKAGEVRPPWAMFAKVNQNMETILFKEKFIDWPDASRLIQVKSQDGDDKEEGYELEPYDVTKMLHVSTRPVDLLLEGSHVGRGSKWVEDYEGLRREFDIIMRRIDVWHVLEYEHYKLNAPSHGQFHAGDTYVIRWHYMITQAGMKDIKGRPSTRPISMTGRERCAYFFWQGRESSVTEQGASALMTVELDEERGPQVRVEQGKEPPCFTNLFKSRMVVHLGRREDETSCTPGLYRLYLVRNEHPTEAYLQEVPCITSSLRSRGCFLLLNVKTGALYVWHGARAAQHTRHRANDIAAAMQTTAPPEVGLHDKASVVITEMEEGSEKSEFWVAMDTKERVYNSLTKDDASQSHTPRLFYMHSVPGVFVAEEVTNPSRDLELCSPFPFAQHDLYNASQPGLFLLDNQHVVYLWQGWWPEESDTLENVRTGSAEARLNVDRRMAVETTLNYCQAKNPDKPPSAYIVYGGVEPAEFTNLFPTWSVNQAAKDSNLKENRVQDEKKSVSDLLTRLTCTEYTLAELMERPLPEGVDPLKIESYFSEAEFEEVLEMSREQFYELPVWKQTNIKKNKALF